MTAVEQAESNEFVTVDKEFRDLKQDVTILKNELKVKNGQLQKLQLKWMRHRNKQTANLQRARNRKFKAHQAQDYLAVQAAPGPLFLDDSQASE